MITEFEIVDNGRDFSIVSVEGDVSWGSIYGGKGQWLTTAYGTSVDKNCEKLHNSKVEAMTYLLGRI